MISIEKEYVFSSRNELKSFVAPVEMGANLIYFRRLTIKGLDGKLANESVALRVSGHLR